MAPTTVQPATNARRDDIATIGLTGLAHFGSHFLQLSLAPLLPLIRADFDVTFTDLGLVLATFYATSGIGQVLAGILVDRVGPHRLLLAGLTLQATSVLLMALAPGYLFLFPLAIGAGLGNTVYHPSDLSILSHRVQPSRQGRAFATHSIMGSIGFAVSPITIGAVGTAIGWRWGLAFGGLVGLGIAAALFFNRRWLVVHDLHPAAGEARRGPAPIPFARIIVLPVVFLGFSFFMLTALANGGVMNFGASALHEGYGAALTLATLIMGAYQGATVLGNLLGGIFADRTTHHHRMAAAGVAAAAAFAALTSLSGLPFAVSVACLLGMGFCFGAVLPSRDVLIRTAAPPGGLGKVFGAVYSGLDAGSVVGPLIFGALLDHHHPELVFLAAAVGLFLAIPTVLAFGRGEVRGVGRSALGVDGR